MPFAGRPVWLSPRRAVFVALGFVAWCNASSSLAGSLDALRPLLKARCYECHSGGTIEGGLDLEKLSDDLTQLGPMAKWVRLHDRVVKGEMPPADAAPIAPAEKQTLVENLARSLHTASSVQATTVIRRLNRVEYENTLHDLLGIRTELRELLPEDGKAYGFDNVGEALDISPVQLQRYMEAAGRALDAAVARDQAPESKLVTLQFHTGRNEQFLGKSWTKRNDGATVFFNDGGYPNLKVHEFRAPVDGRYKFRIVAAAHNSPRPMMFSVFLGPDSFNKSSTLHDYYDAQPGDLQNFDFEGYLARGDNIRLMIPFIKNNYNDVNNKADKFQGPGLAVARIEIEGPLAEEYPGRGHTLRFGDLLPVDIGNPRHRKESWYRPNYQVTSEQPQADIARILPKFVEAAFRRPVTDADVAPYRTLAEAELSAGAKFDQALRTAQIAVLCAPEFLYLIEPVGRLNDHALASRLSYFLWSSGPDAELLAVAGRGELQVPEVLRTQTERLLHDPKARRFTENFVGQWLNLREIDFTTPDKQLYPDYDEPLKHAMMQETELFFQEVLDKNLSLLSFIESDWTFLNERLARHYRIEGVEGAAMRRVSLRPEQQRGGVLTHAAVLKVSANGTTTSPVVRGAYVLQRILGVDPPPPPPNVPGVEPDIRGATTLREQLVKHRSQASCNACHKLIDPGGFALEHYDVMGGYRDNYRSLNKALPHPSRELWGGAPYVNWRLGPKVDASGTTPDGEAFDDLTDYKSWLLARKQVPAYALTEKLATYAAGRGTGFADRPELATLTAAIAAKNYGFRDLVHAVVQSKIFKNK
ncbi:MAG: DUF1592 domain-containing protein [Pirellulales bacterium]